MRFFKIHTIGEGFLAAMPKPEGDEVALSVTMHSIALQGVHKIVCLLEEDEARSLKLENETTLAHKAGLCCIHYPIVDMQVPTCVSSFVTLSQELYDDVNAGINTVIHCRAGIGRTGMLCAAILANAGFSADKAIRLISKSRGVSVPDTQKQIEWLEQNWVYFSAKT